MKYKISLEVITIFKTIQENGYVVFLVGGGVRGLLMEESVYDWDMATNATPEQIQKMFPDSFYENTYGTVGVPVSTQDTSDSPKTSHSNVVEITTFRHEGVYRDRRRPEEVTWGETIEEDLARRDFTINAIALTIDVLNLSAHEHDGEFVELDESKVTIVDPYDGVDDLLKKVIRSVGDANKRFEEDALRLMRAVRIATQLNFSIEKSTLSAVIKHSSDIGLVACERVREELMKILASKHAYEGIKLLDETGMLDEILPELTKGKGVSMVRPGRHHTTDVFEHNLLALKHCPSKDPVVRFAALLHDVGKPETRDEDKDGLVIFYNHEVVGAHIASRVAERLRFSKKDREKIYTLVRWHMFSVEEHISDKAVRRFIRRVGIENIGDMIDIRIGDRLGSGAKDAEGWRLQAFKERIEKELHPAFSLNDLAIDGDDVMKILEIKPGRKVGEILNTVFEEVDDDLSLNTKEYLEARVKELGKTVS